jgi:hypothetical protein
MPCLAGFLADIGSEKVIWDKHQVLNMPFVAKCPQVNTPDLVLLHMIYIMGLGKTWDLPFSKLTEGYGQYCSYMCIFCLQSVCKMS